MTADTSQSIPLTSVPIAEVQTLTTSPELLDTSREFLLSQNQDKRKPQRDFMLKDLKKNEY